MRTGIGLAVIAVGAILAFAVTTNTSVFNLHTAGWVLMIIGIIGMLLPRRTYGWLGTRLIRRTRVYPSGRVREAPPRVAYNPSTTPITAGFPRPTLLADEPVDPQAETEIEDIYEQ